MALPHPETPLYNHPLYEIETWLRSMGCEQDTQELNLWSIAKSTWKAEISLDVEEIVVCYLQAGDEQTDIKRVFKYSLSREDVEDAIFSGP
ncbi:DUF3143 domain-containing protein [Gloeocapsa sp. PCC 73106]|uniref:DUF3143 domain-containing protein n=1 Tax=Gloeocapsa sp. PCC 73106 TaxID=102232 RepID=UPI0002ABA53F|nr:DUF3143 domain-containing protein [Gloeocapsa sp. PCC 73106]ELR97048.1 Protein of unknown function (DUF3143) [Gloeocapsa sp. PCC 73106]